MYASQLVSYGAMPALMEGLGLGSDYGSMLVLGSALLLAVGMLGAMGVMLVRLTGDGEEAGFSAAPLVTEKPAGMAATGAGKGSLAGVGEDAPGHAGAPAAMGTEGFSTADRLRHLQPSLGLTDREVEIGCLLAQGHSYKKVAEVLVISLSTVQSHTRNLYRKCGVNARQGLIDMLAEMGDSA